jgi:hypothetical protein
MGLGSVSGPTGWSKKPWHAMADRSRGAKIMDNNSTNGTWKRLSCVGIPVIRKRKQKHEKTPADPDGDAP